MRGDEVQICKENLNLAQPFSCTGLIRKDPAYLIILILYLLGLVLLDEYQLDEDVAVLGIVYHFEDVTLRVFVGLRLFVEDDVVLMIWGLLL